MSATFSDGAATVVLTEPYNQPGFPLGVLQPVYRDGSRYAAIGVNQDYEGVALDGGTEGRVLSIVGLVETGVDTTVLPDSPAVDDCYYWDQTNLVYTKTEPTEGTRALKIVSHGTDGSVKLLDRIAPGGAPAAGGAAFDYTNNNW